MFFTVAIFALTASLGVTGWFFHTSNGVPYRVAAQPDGVNTWDNLTFAQPCNLLPNGPNFDVWCNIGNAPLKTPTKLLIGDSVSNNFAPMLQKYAERSGDPTFVFRQFGRGLCHGFAEIAMDNCRELTEAAKAYIQKAPSIDTIILAVNWRLYYYGFERPGKPTVKSQEFKDAFEKNVAYFQSLGKRVVVFLAPPVGANPRSRLTRPIRLAEQSNCNLLLKEALYNAGDSRDYILQFLAVKNIEVFDSFKYFCDDISCRVTDGTRIYYLDHEHFSIFGGHFLAEAANKELSVLLRSRSK